MLAPHARIQTAVTKVTSEEYIADKLRHLSHLNKPIKVLEKRYLNFYIKFLYKNLCGKTFKINETRKIMQKSL